MTIRDVAYGGELISEVRIAPVEWEGLLPSGTVIWDVLIPDRDAVIPIGTS